MKEVWTGEAEEYAKKYGMKYLETSIYDIQTIEMVFNKILKCYNKVTACDRS